VLVLAVGAALIAVGAAELSARAVGALIPTVLTGLGLLGTGVAVLAWPGMSLTALTTIAGVALLVTGALRLWSSLRRTVEQRLTSAILGATGILFGVLALAWPDITQLVLAVESFSRARSWQALRRVLGTSPYRSWPYVC
jgi:Short repeat of unknown function (DUF308)